MVRHDRIISSNAHKYLGRNVTVVGEVTTITPHANTVTLRMPDDETIIVLLQKNSTSTIEPNLLTEVAGKLVSRGQIEASHIRQYNLKETSIFNRSLYAEACLFYDAHKSHYDP